MNLLKKIPIKNGYRIRGIIYIAISLIGLGYELLFIRPFRMLPIFLWIGVLGIGLVIFTSFKDNTKGT